MTGGTAERPRAAGGVCERGASAAGGAGRRRGVAASRRRLQVPLGLVPLTEQHGTRRAPQGSAAPVVTHQVVFEPRLQEEGPDDQGEHQREERRRGAARRDRLAADEPGEQARQLDACGAVHVSRASALSGAGREGGCGSTARPPVMQPARCEGGRLGSLANARPMWRGGAGHAKLRPRVHPDGLPTPLPIWRKPSMPSAPCSQLCVSTVVPSLA